MSAYIIGVGAYLPNEAVSNEEIEPVLRTINKKSSRVKRIILKRNGIEKRYYALDRQTGRQTHTNAQLAAEAIENLARNCDFDKKIVHREIYRIV